MELNPVIERFYLSALSYAGLKFENGVIQNDSEKLGEFTIDNRPLSLPYFSLLKNPENKVFFHPLNENYASPETAVFDLYRKRLTLEVNLRLSTTIVNLIAIAADVQIQQRVKNPKLVEIICQLGEIDHTVTEAFLGSIKNAKAKNNEGFLIDFYLKKTGEVDGVPYAAVGKVNFNYLNELRRSLEEKDKDYRVFGYKMRKKDILALIAIFSAIFPDVDTPFSYEEGTDNKIFRYLNILLKVSYLITNRLNHLSTFIAELNESCLSVEGMVSNHDWVETLEPLYDMSQDIRLIPNQTDITVESNKLHVNEQKAANVSTNQPTPQEVVTSPPQFNPNLPQVAQTPQMPQAPQPLEQQRPMTSEEILEQRAAQRAMNMGMMPSGYPPGMPQMPMYPGGMPMMPNQPPMMPSWVQMETARQQPQVPYQQPMMPQMPMYPTQVPQMPMGYPNQPMMPQMPMYPNQMQPQYQQPGLQLNPMMFGRPPGY